jgi:integrase/recombinase XerD
VRLRGKGGKERFVPIRELVQEAIRGWQKVRPRNSEWLFTSLQGARFSEHQFWKATKRYALQALGAEGQRKVHPHALRAAFIKFQLDKGTKVDVLQQLVGHSRGDTTLGYVREIELLKSGADRALDGLDGD